MLSPFRGACTGDFTSRVLSRIVASLHCLMAIGDVARRYTLVCILPLSHYGWDRAPRPPPLQHRVLIRATALVCLRTLACGRRQSQITPGAFFVTGAAISRRSPLDRRFSASRHPATSY